MLIMKFGGTSVGSAERIRATAEIIKSKSEEEACVVVLSAMSGTTNNLLEIAGGKPLRQEVMNRHAHTVDELGLPPRVVRRIAEILESARTREEIVACGELFSTTIMLAYLYKQGVDAAWLPALEYMRLDDDGRPDPGEIKARVIPLIRRKGQHRVYITQGFIGRNRNDGAVATLSRGGSDYTATLLGEALGADEVQIWTDVDGVYSADPRIVPNAHYIATMSYSLADAAARLGAKILHPECVQPAMRAAYRLRVLDSFHPDAPGTLIGPYDDSEGLVALARIKGDNDSEISIVGHKSAIERISSEQLASLPGVSNIRKVDSYVSMIVDNSLSDETMRTIHKQYFE